LFNGCERQNGEAIVLTKEYIAATPPGPENPSDKHVSSPTGGEEQTRAIGDDEITVDGYVMKPEVRGTSHDPRALKDEQWLVKVRMIDKLHEGHRVRVRYQLGKYTKTVWGGEIEGH
jgi:hypothetical protein